MSTAEERRARAWWASQMPSDRETRQDDLRRQLDRFGIDLPADKRGWIMAAYEAANA